MTPFTLYWIETPSSEENCFVAARSKRAAAKYEEAGSGFDPGTCRAYSVRALEKDWIDSYLEANKAYDPSYPFYVQLDDLEDLGLSRRVVDGNDVFEFEGRDYIKQGDLNFLASLAKDPRIVVIRSLSDLLSVIRQGNYEDWIFRGHSSCFWELEAGVHRALRDIANDKESVIASERRLLAEFKRRARIFLASPPASDWEWLVLAQHFGLPTRLLVWSENPLVALYFATREAQQTNNDGMLFAYRHGTQEIDIESMTDPSRLAELSLSDRHTQTSE